MSIWASRAFFLSADVDLDLKVYVGTLQLLHAPSSQRDPPECYVSLQVIDDGIPLHPFSRATNVGQVSGSRIVLNEWIALPIKIRDLPHTAQLLVKLWSVQNVCVGGAVVRCFDSKLALRRGLHPVVLWRHAPDLSPLLADIHPATDSPLSLLMRLDRGTMLLKEVERYALGEVPLSPWTDRLVMAQVQKDVVEAATRASTAASDTAATTTTTSTTSADQDAAATTTSNGAKLPGVKRAITCSDALHVGHLNLHFPVLPHPVLYEDGVYQPDGYGPVAAASADGQGNEFGDRRSCPPLLLASTATSLSSMLLAGGSSGGGGGGGGTDTPTAADSVLAANVAGRAYWSEQLCMLYDPEEDTDLDNPADSKYHKLARGGAHDADTALKPNRVELARIQALTNSQELHTKLSPEMTDLLWKFRYSLTSNKKALIKFAHVVDWADEEEAKEGAMLLSRWAPIDVEDALRLLTPEFDSPVVRTHAVQALARASDEELTLFLLQLVQALRYEPQLAQAQLRPVGAAAAAAAATTDALGPADGAASNASAPTSPALAITAASSAPAAGPGAGQGAAWYRLSPLADFLIDRACRSLELGNFLHWYLMVELEDKRQGNLFRMVHDAFHEQLLLSPAGRAIADVLKAQQTLMSRLNAAAAEALGNKRDRVEVKIDKLNRLLMEGGSFDDIVVLRTPVPTPLDPAIRVSGIVPRGAHMFKSALYPTVITFKVSPDSEIAWTSAPTTCGLAIHDVARRAAVEALHPPEPGSSTVSGSLRAGLSREVTRSHMTLSSSSSADARSPIKQSGEERTQGQGQGQGRAPALSGSSERSLGTMPVTLDVAAAITSSMPPGVPAATYRVVFKNGDDMRQDQLIIQMIRLMDAQLKRVGLDLRLTPYRVLATGSTSGMMEMVLDSLPVSAVIEKYRGNPVQAFLRAAHPREGAEFGIDPEVMETYIRSCAGYCVITYLMGIGDRHLDNIMLRSDGHLFHLDFGYIFGRDPKPLPPPMRITAEMIDGMGGPQSANYSRFKSYCCQAYNILRRSANLVAVLLSLMVDAGIEDLVASADPRTTIAKLHEKFRVDIDDEAADAVFLRLVDDSVAAMFPAFFEVIHKIRVAMR